MSGRAPNPNLMIQEHFVAAVFAGDGATIEALAPPYLKLQWAFHDGRGVCIKPHYFNALYTGG